MNCVLCYLCNKYYDIFNNSERENCCYECYAKRN